MLVCDSDKRVPHAKKSNVVDVVVWWDRKENSWKVFDDVCPHRLAPLSKGRIDPWGRLQCFNGSEWSQELVKNLSLKRNCHHSCTELPLHVIEGILIRLPVGSLIRFKSVSKLWYSTINDPNFIRYQVSHVSSVEYKDSNGFKNLLLHPLIRNPLYGFRSVDFVAEGDENILKQIPFTHDHLIDPLFVKYPLMRIWSTSSCDGLVLMAADKDYITILNLSIKQVNRIPVPGKVCGDVFGLGYDYRSNNYKIFRAPSGIPHKKVSDVDKNMVQIYSFETNS
eukprot:XP_015583391.1 F-box protein CPR1 [Ricinus communis]